MPNLLKVMKIDRNSAMPMYVQISDSIELGVKNGSFGSGYPLPSINDLCYALDMSKNTVEKAYNRLKEKGVLDSARGKGYYISCMGPSKKRILLLFNKLSVHKKMIYEAFMSVISDQALVDLCVYNDSIEELSRLVDEKHPGYTSYVVIPPFTSNDSMIDDILKKIPVEKLFILDRTLRNKRLCRGAVFQDFESDIYGALVKLESQLSKYAQLKIVFAQNPVHAREILNGFRLFCRQRDIPFDVIHNIHEEEISAATAYISLIEDDLAILIDKMWAAGLEPGKDVGLISYNETPIKKVILNGLTTISTDFKWMGQAMAHLVLNDAGEYIPVPFHTISRGTL
jgi:DNA-binding transcriptional regulator YhcF (GntR family)